MKEVVSDANSLVAIVVDVGRTTVRIGITDEQGRLRPDTVKAYDHSSQSTLSSAISTFARDRGLARLPRRCAIAVSGVPRGDTMTKTNSRWILSRSGLASMFQTEPLIINDFAANAWAVSSQHCSGRAEAVIGPTVRAHQPGVFCIIGVGSGLGVASLSRDEQGSVRVIPTEGGHTNFLAGLPGFAPVAEIVGARTGYTTAEMLLSGPGIMEMYRALARIRGVQPAAKDLAALLEPGAFRSDPIASETIDLFARGLWHFAGNMVLAQGAWDGVLITGSVVAGVRSVLRRADVADSFAIHGPFAKRLAEVPRSVISFQHAELEGAAVALLMDKAQRSTAAGLTLAA